MSYFMLVGWLCSTETFQDWCLPSSYSVILTVPRADPGSLPQWWSSLGQGIKSVQVSLLGEDPEVACFTFAHIPLVGSKSQGLLTYKGG